MDLEDYLLEEWICRRSKVMKIYYAAAFHTGLLISAYISTELLYIKQIVHDAKPLLYLTLLLGLSNTSSVIAAFFGSIYYDFTFKVKEISATAFGIVALGNILYVLPYSIWFPLVGTTIIGIYTAAIAAALAEITHIVEEKDLTKTLGVVGALKTIGMFSGPCLAYVFVNVDVTIGGWHLNYGNMPGIVMGILSMIVSLLLYVTLDNLAKIYDLKAHQEREGNTFLAKENDIDDESIHDEIGTECEINGKGQDGYESLLKFEKTEEKSLKLYLRNAWYTCTGRHYSITVISSAVASFSHFLAVNLIIVITVELLQGGVLLTATVRIVTLLGGIIGTLLVIYCSKWVRDFYQLYAIVTNTMLILAAVILIPYIKIYTAQVIVLILAGLYLGIVEAAVHVVSITMAAKLVKSEMQGIAEALRLVLFYLAHALSGFIVSTIYEHMIVGGVIVIVLNLCSAFALAFEIDYFTKTDL